MSSEVTSPPVTSRGGASPLHTRPAVEADCEAIARIYNQGIEDRTATFETRPRTAADIASWLGTRFPTLVTEDRDGIVAWAAASQFRARECYSGIAELSVYVAREGRGKGAGRAALGALIATCEAAGFWKLVAGVLTANSVSLHLLSKAGFRDIGVYRSHARHEGRWHDVALLELLLGDAARDAALEAARLTPCADPA